MSIRKIFALTVDQGVDASSWSLMELLSIEINVGNRVV